MNTTHHSHLSKLLTVALSATLCHCASPTQLLTTNPCEVSDSYELGRRHGSQGLVAPTDETLNSPIFQCVPKEMGEARQKYDIGYNSGLANYCTKENGFNIGRSNLSYNRVCPTLSERSFLLGYSMGVEVRKMQLENQKLESKIGILEENLKTLSPESQRSRKVSLEIAQLKNQLGQNIRKIKTQSL